MAKRYGDTADECGEAFYWCGKALLDLARMENSVLGNALQGVPEEEEDEEKPKDSKVEMESTESLDEKTRDELRVQVYDAMAEKKEETSETVADEKKGESTTEKADAEEKADSTSDVTKDGATEKEDTTPAAGEPATAEKQDATSAATEKAVENKSNSPVKEDSGKDSKAEDQTSAEKPSDSDENKENIEAEPDTGEKEKDAEETENVQAEDDGDEEIEGGEEAEETEGDEKADGEDTAEKGSDDEEVGNLQLAWEMLEVAKVIYKRKETKEDQLMAAQTHLKLGEVSAESGNYTQAIEDFQECLKLQLKHLESASRLLAETHYQLGLTYSLNCQYKQAIDELNSSISAIKSRLEKLKELIDKAEGPDALPDERKEMVELEALLPDIQEKVEDATEGLKTASTAVEAVKGVLDGNTASETDNQTSTKANDKPSEQATAADISHLVRKKRKPEESPVKEVKKVKQDDAQTNGAEKPQNNGVHTNGHTKEHSNGQSTSMEVESN